MVPVTGVSGTETTIISLEVYHLLSYARTGPIRRLPDGPHGGAHEPARLYTLIIVATASIAIIAFSVILLLFPRLQGMASTESIRPAIERGEARGDEGNVSRGRAVEEAMRLLEPDEKRVVEALVTGGGSMLQKDISHNLKFSRVKTHRVLVRLLKRGVVTAEKQYNTNRIELVDWLRE